MVVVSIGALALIFLVLLSSEGPRDTSMTFVGFTNGPAGQPEALFCITNQKDVLWYLYSMHRKTEAAWSPVDVPTAYSIYRQADHKSKSCVIGVPVDSTNASWRIVLQCRERRKVAEGLLDRAREVGERIFTRQWSLRYDGRVYDVTNEIIHAK
jgi:hypothetical protein